MLLLAPTSAAVQCELQKRKCCQAPLKVIIAHPPTFFHD